MSPLFDYIVIGKGLFGAAAVKYLSKQAGRVAVIGPDEPPDIAAHDGVFASHYDQGRLAGHLGRTPQWTALAAQSIAVYRRIEVESGIRFYTPAGRLYVPAASVAPAYAAEMASAHDLDLHHLSAAEMAAHFPYLRFPGAPDSLYEGAPAGYINPRALIRAQLVIAERWGAHVIREVVTAVDTNGNQLTVRTKEGHRYRARKVLIAAGAFSSFIKIDGRDEPPLPLRLKTETILLAETPGAEASRLHSMPAVSFEIESTDLNGIYLLPPLRYPDGRTYVKMGCDTAADTYPQTMPEITAWFKSGDSDAHKDALIAALQSILPDLETTAFKTGRCIITYTSHGRPYIDELLPGRLYTAVGGNGTGAKSSDAIGRLAAEYMTGQLGTVHQGFHIPR
jgi:glycine/D-amino acid oxidase-like deaminating enzyme